MPGSPPINESKMKAMRVAELTALRQFRLIDQTIADPGPGEVQARVQAVGICGSDLHAYAEGGIGGAGCLYPMVLGHEPAGVVQKVGAGVSGWSPGDPVALEPALYCYHCEPCLAGRHNLCANLRFLSSPGDPGFFREYVNLPAPNLLALPPHLDANQASLIEPLAVVLHSTRFGEPRPGETAAVFGAGPIGLLTVVVLKLSGASRVWSIDPVPARRELAKRLGADAAIDPESVDVVKQVLTDTARRGVDVVFDCAAKPGSIRQSIQVARAGGRVVFTGIPSELETPVDFHSWRRKELTFFAVRRSNHEGRQARDLLAAYPARFTPIITHSRPLDQIGAAFAQVERREDGVGKLVIRVDQ
jgi:L-iditol 2-dehydrogenase